MSRPENQKPAEFFYNEEEAQKYSNCTRIIQIQQEMTERAIELLNLRDENESHQMILDIGCGSGLSGHILSNYDHYWIGMDISQDMLNVAIDRESEGELINADIGQGFKFRPGVFDAAISISAVQWLCVAAKKAYNPYKRLSIFFQSLYNSIKQGGRAVLQIYPENKEQLDMITKASIKAGFAGHLVVDFPNSSKAKKLYLVLDTISNGQQTYLNTVEGLQEDKEQIVQNNSAIKTIYQAKKKITKKDRIVKKSKQWINNKKDRQRKQGKEVKQNSKYTARQRNNNYGVFG